MNRLLSASDPLVHSVLVALCDDERIQARALKYLAALEDYAAKSSAASGDDTLNESPPGGTGTGSTPTTTTTTNNPRKRKTSTSTMMASNMPAQLCIMCKGAFSPGENSPTACLYHEGQLMIDEDHEVWEDWNVAVGGPQVSPDNEEDYPQAFIWSCCDEDGTKPGCVKGYHLAVRQNSSKRFRISFPPGAEPDRNRIFEGRALKANEFVNETLDPNRSAWGPSSTVRAYESSSSSSSSDHSHSVRSEGLDVAPEPARPGMDFT